jgi:predicted transglutaminase-like cysteine proteinase
MLHMAVVHLRVRKLCLWRNSTAAIRAIASLVAVVAAPSALMAQTGTISAQSTTLVDCSGQRTDRPIQIAIAPLGKIEPGAGPMAGSKAAAILGGAVSKLEQMRLAQASGSANSAVVAIGATQALVDEPGDGCDVAGDIPLQPNPAPQSALPANAILGSLSIAITRTPFDRDWSAVNARQGSRKVEHVLAATGARRAGDQATQVEAVNRWVNQKIEFGEDRDIYGRADYWAPAAETFRRGIGDCEDFAIAKMELLSALGISRDKMRLVVARDLVRNADHAVLVVTLASGAVMLDNMTDRLLDARLPNDYRPIMSFSQNAKWVHGYAVQPAQPVRMASANIAAQPAASKFADVMTVTAEPEMPTLSMALLSVPLVLPNGLSARA